MSSADCSECQRGESFKQARTIGRCNHGTLKGSQLMSPRLANVKVRQTKHRRQSTKQQPTSNTATKTTTPHHRHSHRHRHKRNHNTHHKHISISSAGTGPLLLSGKRSGQVHVDNFSLHGTSNSSLNEWAHALWHTG